VGKGARGVGWRVVRREGLERERGIGRERFVGIVGGVESGGGEGGGYPHRYFEHMIDRWESCRRSATTVIPCATPSFVRPPIPVWIDLRCCFPPRTARGRRRYHPALATDARGFRSKAAVVLVGGGGGRGGISSMATVGAWVTYEIVSSAPSARSVNALGPAWIPAPPLSV